MAELININPLDPNTFEFQDYSLEDTSLINSNQIETTFNPESDYIEYFVYDLNNNILFSNEVGFPNYTLEDNQLSIDPLTNLQSVGYSEGDYNTLYNIFSPKLGSSALNRYYIDEISADRTEIRLNTTSIPNEQVVSSTNDFLNQIQNSVGEYLDFYLNFGSNILIIANNVLLDNTNPDDPTVLIKLYEPLPTEFSLKTECWVVEKVAESIAYNISITQTFDLEDENIKIKGPNLNIGIKDQINNSTEYVSYNTLANSTSQQGTGSYLYQINSLLAEKGIEINVDYTDYSNFVHMSSAQTRLENFYYKLSLIETYQTSASLSSGTATNYYVSSSNIIWQNKIDEIITNFDGYEYYLYYESGSKAWPKTNSIPPYVNDGANSVAGLAFLTDQSISASLYDSENDNALVNSIPSYLREDPDNAQYELFIEMLAQMFDNIYLYIGDVTNKFNADNRLDYGISKDLVADVLRDLGVKIYQNNFSSNDLYTALLGITNSGSLFNIPDASTLLPTPTGLEFIDTFVTASSTSSLSPVDDLNKEIYKRIYHNLPYLLKKKGTVEGLRTLINIYGIPDTILRINEFGGKDKNINTWDYWQNEYNYAYKATGSYYLSSSFALNSTWGAPNDVPGAVEFRFKAESVPPTNTSQSLWYTDKGLGVFLEYTGTGLSTGSYSGSVVDSNYQYGTLKFISGTESASVYLPFFNEGWWSVLVNSSSDGYTLYAKNNIYSGNDGNTLGFQASSTLNISTLWSASAEIYFASSSTTHEGFSGSLQEIRYYTQPITEDSFNAYVMNPNSIEQSQYLAFRASLGGELYTGSTSIHPKITGSWTPTSSFTGTSDFYISSTPTYLTNTEVSFYDQPSVGIQNAVSNKIKQGNNILPPSNTHSNIPDGNVLSPYRSVQQSPAISSSYTRDVDYVEVAFSPQNEINEDIMDTFGYFNIGEYIGDPRQISSTSTSYPDLNTLRDEYFKKYTHNYDIWDYVRLIKYFDNSLFKMIKDWTPARTSLATGVVIKQHLLERNKYPVPQVSFSQSEYTASIGMYEITGSNAGGLNITSIVTQSWTGTTPSVSGAVAFTQDTEDEFFNGEFSGSELVVTDGEVGFGIDLTQIGSWQVSLFFTNVSNVRITPIIFDFDFEQTYYVKFNYLMLSNGDSISLQDGSGKVYYTSNITSSISGSITDLIEIKNPFAPLGFLRSGSGGVGVKDVYIYKYVIQSFDADPLLNNVLENRPNPYYIDVDYSTSQNIPVNLQTILSGSGTRFPIPESNYTIKRSANPRYFGSKTKSPVGSIFEGYVNQPMTEGSSIGAVTNIENYCNWFAYFDNIDTTVANDPPIGGTPTNVNVIHVTTLLDINGNKIDLSPSNNIPLENSSNQNPLVSNIGILKNIFPPGNQSSIIQYNTPQTTVTGSFTPVTIYTTGTYWYYDIISGLVYADNETLITTIFKSNFDTNQPGLLLPQNFNPKLRNSVLEIAQSAGFFTNI